MAKPFDATTRRLLEVDPAAWLSNAGLDPTPDVRVIDSDVSTITAQADAVVQVGDPPTYLAHFELQSGRDQDLARRLLHYNVLLGYLHRLPVRTVAYLLRPQADDASLDGLHREAWPDGTIYHQFRYDVVRVWRLDVEAILRGGLGTLPLAPLAVVSEAELPGVIGRIGARLDREVSDVEAGLLWSATNILMGLRFSPGLVSRLFQGVQAMKESATYQAIVDEGRVEGLAKGRVEGRVEMARRLLLKLGGDRFKAPDAAIRARIEAIADPDQLEELAGRVYHVSSWGELLDSP